MAFVYGEGSFSGAAFGSIFFNNTIYNLDSTASSKDQQFEQAEIPEKANRDWMISIVAIVALSTLTGVAIIALGSDAIELTKATTGLSITAVVLTGGMTLAFGSVAIGYLVSDRKPEYLLYRERMYMKGEELIKGSTVNSSQNVTTFYRNSAKYAIPGISAIALGILLGAAITMQVNGIQPADWFNNEAFLITTAGMSGVTCIAAATRAAMLEKKLREMKMPKGINFPGSSSSSEE